MNKEEAIESFKYSNEQAKVRLEVEKMRMDMDEVKELEFYIERDEMAIKALEQQPKTGHWEWLTENKYRCSNCKHETRVDECFGYPMYDFCPFCRARMESEERK